MTTDSMTKSASGYGLRGASSGRVRRLKECLVSSPYEIDIERARHYTKAWRRTEDLSPCLRTAQALEETLRNMTIRVETDEQLVGIRTAKHVGVVLPVERSGEDMLDVNPLLAGGKTAAAKSKLSEEELRELSEDIFPYWKDKTAASLKTDLWKQAGFCDEDSGMLLPTDLGLVLLDTQGHVIPGYKRVLRLGFRGIADLARRELLKLDAKSEDYESRRDFLESVLIVGKAVCDHSERYADLADEMAKNAEGARQAELREIAERCRRVPAEPPRTFMEALQSLWMAQVALTISYGIGDVFSVGRVDQYLYPYYRADLEAGRITRENALESIEEYFLKLCVSILPASYNVTLGGVDRDGEDATNEISYLFLETVENIGGLNQNVSVRISPKTPKDFLLKAWETHRYTAGVAFYNDDIIIRDLLADSYAMEDARDYSIVGCVEPTSTGNDFSYTAGNFVSLVRALDLALNAGCSFVSGDRRVGAPTPPAAAFKTFEEVKSAFAEQVALCVEQCVRAAELKDRVFAENYPSPLLSSTIEGCVESGKDITRGGALYNNGHIGTQGLATVANSLAAIQWAVFEQELMTMEELLGHVHNNYEDAEPLRQRLLHKAPKYGNDDNQADELASWIVEVFCNEVRKHKCARGGIYRPLILSTGFQVFEGMFCAATPDGRRAGEPVSDGISPAHGTERNGITAVLSSAASAGKALVSDGTTLTLHLSPSLLKTDAELEKMAFLLETYFKLGGRQVQFTPVDADTLRDAQAHPEKYSDLTVKVSGYSAVFADLPTSLQDDIIGRTEFSKV